VEETAMAMRLGPSIALAIGLSLTSSVPARAQAQFGGFDEARNTFGLCRVQLRNLTAAVRARLDDADAGAARASEMRQRQRDQMMIVVKAKDAFERAKLRVEVAEIAVVEYEAGTFKQSLETIEGDIAMAKAELKRAEDHFEDSQKHVEETKTLVKRIEGFPRETIGELMSEYYAGRARVSAEYQVLADKFGIDKAKFTLEQAETSKEVLLKFTKDKTIKELKAAIEMAKSDMLMKEMEVSLTRDAERRLERDAQHTDNRELTAGERAALAKFSALEEPWRAILARRGEIEKADPAKRDEWKKILDDFAKALNEADGAWSSAREARLDDRDADTMRRAPGALPARPFGGAVR
jgi:hypothetical protein